MYWLCFYFFYTYLVILYCVLGFKVYIILKLRENENGVYCGVGRRLEESCEIEEKIVICVNN